MKPWKNIQKIGISMMVAAVVALLFATVMRNLEKQRAVEREESGRNQKTIGNRQQAQTHADWIEKRLDQADKEWLETHDQAAADAKAIADIKAQEQIWRREDEKERANEESASKERRAAAAEIRAHFYFHFGIVWLLIFGICMALSFSVKSPTRR